ncbi:MAG: YrdB family protein [Acidobacteria bacterium]|nr:YrdB family protein [Acidobacteriota bacterium]
MSRRRAPSTPVAVTGLHLTLAFVLEVAMLAGVGYWGFRGGFTSPWTYIVGIGFPAVLIVLWGVFMAPHAARRLPEPILPIVALVLFLSSAVALMVSGQPVLGWIMAVVAVANTILGLVIERRG